MGIFSSEHARKLLHNKCIVLIGDSVQRSVYKDLVVLCQENRFIKDKELRAKGEESFFNDRLVHRSELTNGIQYQEIREYKTNDQIIRFYFVTRIYNKYVQSILDDFMEANQPTPDVVLVNSCLWDLTKYGPGGRSQYQKNLERFCTELDKCVPVDTCIIWRTTLPVSQRARGGFLSKNVANCANTLLVDVLLANHLAHTIVTQHKYDVVDMHFLFTQQQQRRAKDGVHWNMYAHRRMTNILLTHISDAWGLGIPVQPSFDETVTNFNPKDISMNTTDVLHYAYQNARKLTDEELRYGGPIRSSNEMYDLYNSFYIVPKDLQPQNDEEHYVDEFTRFIQQHSNDIYQHGEQHQHQHLQKLQRQQVVNYYLNQEQDLPYYFNHKSNNFIHNQNNNWIPHARSKPLYKMRPQKASQQKKTRRHPYKHNHR